MIALYRRFAALDRSDRRLVLEAASLTALVWAGLRLLRFSTLRRILDRYAGSAPGRNAGQPHPGATAQVRWAITAVAARLPSATCLVQALAADSMLRHRGLTSEVHIGVRAVADSDVPVQAHAWVECGGAVVTGAIEDFSDFKVLPAPRPR